MTPSSSGSARLDRVALKVEAMLKNALKGISPTPEINLGGSYARGTWLRGSFDIDYFMLYPPDYTREKLETEAVQTAKKALSGYKINLRFAEHPYVEGFVDDVRVNLVPCYKVALGEWKSAADRSPYHTKYIVSKMDSETKMQARLFKKFVKTCGTYGAEVRVQGFSGYVCEVLTLKYGSFEKVIEAFSRLKENEIISIEDYDKDLATSFKSPLVILDPVDTTRNLGAAISPRNVAKLVFEARRFIGKPSIAYFTERRNKFAPPKILLERTFVVIFKSKWRSPDILWGQLRKSAAAVANKLETLGFQVLRTSVASDESSLSAFLFLFTEEEIGSVHSRKGPEYFRGEEIRNYYEKNRRKTLLTWIAEGGRVESVFLRNIINATDALKMLLSKELDSTGVSEEIRNEISKGFKVSSGKQLARKKDWLGNAISSLVSEE